MEGTTRSSIVISLILLCLVSGCIFDSSSSSNHISPESGCDEECLRKSLTYHYERIVLLENKVDSLFNIIQSWEYVIK